MGANHVLPTGPHSDLPPHHQHDQRIHVRRLREALSGHRADGTAHRNAQTMRQGSRIDHMRRTLKADTAPSTTVIDKLAA